MNAAELFAAVYAAPHDDQPRSVLADLLQQQGDPRGEFIALQLARGRGGKKTRRESQLLKPNIRTWLGPLVMSIPNKGLVYERGFVAKCQVHLETIAEHVHHPEWATVEEVELGRRSAVHRGSLQPLADALTGLRALKTEENAGLLPSHPTLEKIEVAFVYQEKDSEHLATLKLPKLRDLVMPTCYPTLAEMKPFFTKTRSLQRLSVGSVEDPEAWIRWLAKAGYERAGVSTTMNPWTLWFEDDRIIAEYHYSGHQEPRAAAHLVERLEMVPSPKQWHVTVQRWDVNVKLGYSWTGTSVASIKRGASAALKRFASYEIVEGETK